jgi:putative salt-induced outer membrane protein YdiY
LLVESGSSNTLVTDAFALNVKVSDRLALGVGVSYQYNSKPPESPPPALPLKKVDTTETVNLVYSF